MTQPTNAQRLADWLHTCAEHVNHTQAASELRRLAAIESGCLEQHARDSAELRRLCAERDHWKANHAHEVERARLLKERTDMPVERVQAYELVATLRAQVEALKLERQRLTEIMNGQCSLMEGMRAELIHLKGDVEAPSAARPMTVTEVNDVGLVPVVLKPFTPAQRKRLWENSKEHHKDAASFTGFERIVTLTERAHHITDTGAA